MTGKLAAGVFWPAAVFGVFVTVPVGALAQGQPLVAPAPVRVTLDQAIEMARMHNHALLAARTTILQNQAQEITANLRPNPVLLGDAQFLPLFQPNNFSTDYLANNAQFDVGVSYLFERGDKRQHRLLAARDQTAVTTAQVADNERTLTFNVASQFIAALLAQSQLDFADQDLMSFQQTVDISQSRFNAGAMSEGDLLKIKLQLLQFQMDVSSARLARLQALATLRQLLGYESVPENYEADGALAYQAIALTEAQLRDLALQNRPDLRAARLGVTAAESQHSLAQA
ncbi:MAG TPA: TolC family protein, partial [Vicinamibacterales bacterium]|nr:TolC family protein [Vicinamibacterales bacterium]